MMKFVMRKLALSCILPATLLHAPYDGDLWAQVPNAISKANAGLPTSSKSTPRQRPAAAAAPRSTVAPSRPAPGAPGMQGTPVLVRQTGRTQAVPSETEVQQQLRLLYEKAGQEMPAMNFEELEVPEPQDGVAPGGAVSEQAVPGLMTPNSNYAQPPAPPPKQPNFFERVFLGRKAVPQPPAQRPAPAWGRPNPILPGRPAVAPASTPQAQPQRPNYRPFIGTQGTQPSTQPGTQPGLPPAAQATQRPAAPAYGPAVTNQNTLSNQAPQVRAGQAPMPGQPSANAAGGAGSGLPLRPGATPQGIPTTGNRGPVVQQPAVQQPAASPGNDSLPPLLDELPPGDDEESLELDFGNETRQSPAGQPATTPRGPSADVRQESRNEVSADMAPQAAPQGEVSNPFSGLKLNVPESLTPLPDVEPELKLLPPKDGRPPVIPPALPGSENNLETPLPTMENQPETPQSSFPNPFEDEETATDEPITDELIGGEPVTNEPATEQPVTTPGTSPGTSPRTTQRTTPGTTPGTTPRTSSGTTLRTLPRTNSQTPAAEPARIGGSSTASNENLSRLAQATVKTGLKGFCCVALRQQRMLIESKPQFNATYRGQKYYFSSASAKGAFEKSPELYAPAHKGLDAIALIDDDKSLPGTLDFAAWYQGRLYLFEGRLNLDRFKQMPAAYSEDNLNVDDDEDLTKLMSGDDADAQQSSATNRGTGTGTGQRASNRNLPQSPATFSDDLPVLSISDSLDDLQPIAPPREPAGNTPSTKTTKQPATQAVTQPAIKPAKQPAKQGTQPRITPGTPSAKPRSTPAASGTRRPVSGTLVSQPLKSTSGSNPPKLINPEVRLAPVVAEPIR